MLKLLTFFILAGAATCASISAHARVFEIPPAAHSGGTIFVTNDIVAGSKDFIQKMADRGIGFLKNDSLTDAQRKAEFRKLMRSSYDMRTIGRFALGTYWRGASKKQQEEYQRLFENMVVEVYSRRFGDYKGQDLEITSARAENATDSMVSTVIRGDHEPVKIDWRVRNKNGEYKVIDVVVAGVSMALTQRSDFSSVIQRGGGDIGVLLDHLRNGDFSGTVAPKK